MRKNYEEAQKRIVALETDLQLAEQRVAALEKVQKEEDNGEIKILREQLCHKSELLDKVKYLLSRVAVNEKTLRQRVNIHFYMYKRKKDKCFELKKKKKKYKRIIYETYIISGTATRIEANIVYDTRVSCNISYSRIKNR